MSIDDASLLVGTAYYDRPYWSYMAPARRTDLEASGRPLRIVAAAEMLIPPPPQVEAIGVRQDGDRPHPARLAHPDPLPPHTNGAQVTACILGNVRRPGWADEDTQEIEQVRHLHRAVSAATGWDASTTVVQIIRDRLCSDLGKS